MTTTLSRETFLFWSSNKLLNSAGRVLEKLKTSREELFELSRRKIGIFDNASSRKRFLPQILFFFCSQPVKSERSRGEDEIVADDDRYSRRSDARKLDKRQETTLKDLKSYLLAGYATKLRKLGVRENFIGNLSFQRSIEFLN